MPNICAIYQRKFEWSLLIKKNLTRPFQQQDVRLGYLEGPQLSLDLDESGSAVNTQLSSSPPNTGRASPTQPTTPAPIQEPMELQVDYWPLMRPIGDGKEKSQTKGQDQGKNSVKSTFRNLQVVTRHLFAKKTSDVDSWAISGVATSSLPADRWTLQRNDAMLCCQRKETEKWVDIITRCHHQ